MHPEITEESVQRFGDRFNALHAEVAKRIVGYAPIMDDLLTAMFAGGHVLLEGMPGLGKTLMVRTIAEATRLEFRRIQFTPDLMPADITGTSMIYEDDHGHREFRFQRGPIFANLVLADEVNRATPKTQSAILEAMQERSVTVAGTTHSLPDPFWVMATQNPIELEGTYPLPEAQVDRFFFKIDVRPQGEEELIGIIVRTTGDEESPVSPVLGPEELLELRHTVRQVLVAEFVQRYAARIILATHPEHPSSPEMTRRYIRFGVSPRGVQTLILAAKVRALRAGRFSVACDDVRDVTLPALRHRMIRNFEAEAEGITTDAVLEQLLEHTAEPAAA